MRLKINEEKRSNPISPDCHKVYNYILKRVPQEDIIDTGYEAPSKHLNQKLPDPYYGPGIESEPNAWITLENDCDICIFGFKSEQYPYYGISVEGGTPEILQICKDAVKGLNGWMVGEDDDSNYEGTVVRMQASSEHASGRTPDEWEIRQNPWLRSGNYDDTLPDKYYNYVTIEHPTLGTFTVSTGDQWDVRTDGKPWKFLRREKLTQDQIDFVNQYKKEISYAAYEGEKTLYI